MDNVIDAAGMELEIKKWLYESLELAEALFAIRAEPSPPVPPPRVGRDPAIVRAEIEQFTAALMGREARFDSKCALLLVALNKTARWARELKKCAPARAGIADAFLEEVESTKIVRDIREHDDEYLTGGGRKRDQLTQTIENGAIQMSVHGSITLNGDIRIGGPVSVQAMVKAAKAFLDGLALPAMPA